VKAILALVLVLAVTPAHAEPWYRGHRGRVRLAHMALTGGLGLTYLAGVTVFKDRLTADRCKWCSPGDVDKSFRRALVWDDPKRADLYSSILAYGVAPVVGATLL
jgi:hypothetical protein